MTDPGVPDLVQALIALRDDYGCDQVSAAYVSPVLARLANPELEEAPPA